MNGLTDLLIIRILFYIPVLITIKQNIIAELSCLFIYKKGPDASIRLAEDRESNIIPLVKPSLMYIFFHGSFIHYWKRSLKDMKKKIKSQ